MSYVRGKTKIHKKHLILCEGKDAWKFLVRYLNSDALKENPFFSEDIEVLDLGGNEEFSGRLKALKEDKEFGTLLESLKGMDGFSDVISLLIIRDAELNVQKAVCQVQSVFRKNELEVPAVQGQWTQGTPKTCFLLFPAFGTKECPGTLEDLCVTILNDAKTEIPLEEVETFVEHLEQDCGQTFKHRHKTRLHTYFSVNDEFVSLKLGEAADAGAFNWFHPNLEPLKDCLSQMERE